MWYIIPSVGQVVFYRKYRPQSWGEVLGQEHVTRVLANAVRGKQVAHAYLFSGPRGTGKTSVARIFARELGVSETDFYEIDGASNRGIDEVRALREAVTTRPFDSAYKVYVIDEVHMLTREAFNALLKTLEEPPAHVVFILATTELHKIPETILSRCQSFFFRRPMARVLKKAILDIAKKEKVSLADDAASLIVFLAEGSFRDAEGILEQIVTFSKKGAITREDVESVTGAPRMELVKNFILGMLDKDTKRGLSAVRSAAGQNIDMKIFTRLVMKHLRYALLLSYAPSMKEELIEEAGEEEGTFAGELSRRENASTIPDMLLALIDAHEEISRSYLPELPLELALIKTIGQD